MSLALDLTSAHRDPALGAEIGIESLSKSFGGSNVWSDLTLTVPAGEVTALLGPSGTGKTVLLKCVLGLLKPEAGSIVIDGYDLVQLRPHALREVRKQFGVLFQGGGLFGSINLFDNVAYPLREHTRLGKRAIRDIVMTKLELVGLTGAERKLPAELSGGMRKRAGLARALVMDPQIVLLDEPDSGLDPVRIANLNQLIIDLNAVTGATFLIVTHNAHTARTLSDNVGIIYRKRLAIFGPREIALTSEDQTVVQFLSGSRDGPIGMVEERDTPGWIAQTPSASGPTGEGGAARIAPILEPQLAPRNGWVRSAERRRLRRVAAVLDELPAGQRAAIHAGTPRLNSVPAPRACSPGS